MSRTVHPNRFWLRVGLLRSVVLLACLLVGVIGCATTPAALPADTAWYDADQVTAKFPAKYTGSVCSSQYLTMRDGVKIAIELDGEPAVR